MTAEQRVVLGAVMTGVATLAGAASLLLMREARQRDLETRVMIATMGRSAPTVRRPGAVDVLRRIGDAARRGGRLYSRQDQEHFRAVIAAAGYDARRLLPVLLGAKIALMVTMPVLGLGLGALLKTTLLFRILIMGLSLIIGLLVPDWLLGFARRSYATSLERAAPDALDLLVVCSEAGMGLESALRRVSQEIARSSPGMAQALAGLLNDLTVLPDRREAFAAFADRVQVESLRRVATMLAQSLQFGTPLGQALRAVAAELRRERANALEERAVKLPAQLIFPLVLFIMPALWIVLLGPSFMRLSDVLGSVKIGGH